MEQDHQKKEGIMEGTTIIDKNWKSLTKPNKLEIESNEDKSIAKLLLNHLEKRFWSNYWKFFKKNFIIINSRSSSYSYTD